MPVSSVLRSSKSRSQGRKASPSIVSRSSQLPGTFTVQARPATGLRTPLYILGSGQTAFGELWDRDLRDLAEEAVAKALADAGVEYSEIEAIFVSNKAGGSFNDQRHLNALVSQLFDHQPPAMRIEAACASGGLAVLAAEQALLAGLYKTVLVLGVEKMTDLSAAEVTRVLASAADAELEYGSTFPGLYALLAQAHMAEYGTSREMLTAVSVKNHRHALENPLAQYRKGLSAAQVEASPLVADPLRVLDCSPISDGAAALVLSSAKPSATSAIQILGFGQGQDSLDLGNRESLTSLAATKRAVTAALNMSGVTIDHIQAAEVHDCFTIAELLALEDLGFFAPGEAGQATLDGQTTMGGRLVVNPSGGLKACGHPVGATGVKQLAYLSHYLQAQDLDYGLTHNVGGSGATAVVHILGRESVATAKEGKAAKASFSTRETKAPLSARAAKTSKALKSSPSSSPQKGGQ